MTNDIQNNKEFEHYVSFLINERNSEQNYHNHKENMAWVATYLYLFAIASVTYYLGVSKDVKFMIGYSIVSIIATFLFFVFIYVQFRLRWHAANVIAGLTKALSQLLNKEISLDAQNMQTIEVKGAVYPKFLKEAIDTSSSVSARWYGIDMRQMTELASYSMMILALVTANLIIWLR